MAEDSIPEILAEQRPGHEVPGMRGLYAHASDQMRDDLKAALQTRWDAALHARAALHPHSLLDDPLTPFRIPARNESVVVAFRDTPPARTGTGGRERMISQIPPNHGQGPTPRTGAGPSVRRI